MNESSTIRRSVLELAHILKKDPAFVEIEAFEQGALLLTIEHHFDVSEGMSRETRSFQKEAVLQAIEDLSLGAEQLRAGKMFAVCRKDQILKVQALAKTESEAQGVVFSVKLNDVLAFKDIQQKIAYEIEQEDINAAIYYLTVQVSDIIGWDGV